MLGLPTHPLRFSFFPRSGRPAAAAAILPAVLPLPAFWQCDLADDRLTWSPGVYTLFGIAPQTPLDRRAIVSIYDTDSRAMLERLRANAIAHAESFTFEARIRRPSGEWRRMRVSADVVLRDGRPIQLYGSKQDITDEPA